MASSLRTERVRSAGGVVLRRDDGALQVLLCGRGADRLWALPKGTPEAGEALEQAGGRGGGEGRGGGPGGGRARVPAGFQGGVARSRPVALRAKTLPDAEEDYAWRRDPELA